MLANLWNSLETLNFESGVIGGVAGRVGRRFFGGACFPAAHSTTGRVVPMSAGEFLWLPLAQVVFDSGRRCFGSLRLR